MVGDLNETGDTHIVATATLNIRDGDQMDATTSWNAGAGGAEFDVTDDTQGLSTGDSEENDVGSHDGSTAEAIDERVDNTHYYVQLRHFNYTRWGLTSVTDSTGKTQQIRLFPWFHDTMQ